MVGNKPVYLFTCATGTHGNIGGNSVRAFRSRAEKQGIHNYTIRLGARNPEKARKLFSNIDNLETVYLDLEHPETYAKALKGVSVAFLNNPDFGGMTSTKQLQQFAKAVEDTKPKPPYIIRFAGGGLSKETQEVCREVKCNMLDQHVHAVDVLQHARKEEKFKVSIVDCQSWFFQDFTGIYLPYIKDGYLGIPNVDVCLPRIDTRDIGEVVATMMLNPDKYANKDVVLTGGCKLTARDWVKMISKATGRDIKCSEDEKPFKKHMEECRGPDSMSMWEIFKPWLEAERRLSQLDEELHPEVYEKIAGKPHWKAEEFCKEMAKTSIWSPN